MPALTDPLPPADPAADVLAWAASGAMALTGRPDAEALGPPTGFVARARALGEELQAHARSLGGELREDPLARLAERSAIAGLHRRGTASVGGASRLLLAADGWVAVSLARPDDMALVPAWLELPETPSDPWDAIGIAVAARRGADLVARARMLGLPAASLSETTRPEREAVEPVALGSCPPTRALRGVRVVELASLWAGPLCGSLLAQAGADVIKVESIGRPDGARRGPAAFFDLLNAGKRSVAVDLARPAGAAALARLLAGADVVIEGSRPRALEQMGIDAAALVAGDGPRVWVSITGHGRSGPERDWVAFGDDAAVAGGLVSYDEVGPVFCADAVADPLGGMAACAAALRALGTGDRWLLDISLAAVASAFAGPTLPVVGPVTVTSPRVPMVGDRGPRLGEHDEEVLPPT